MHFVTLCLTLGRESQNFLTDSSVHPLGRVFHLRYAEVWGEGCRPVVLTVLRGEYTVCHWLDPNRSKALTSSSRLLLERALDSYRGQSIDESPRSPER